MKWRTLGRVALMVFAVLAVPVIVAALGVARATGQTYTARDVSAPPVSVDAVAPPAHDPAKPTAVIVLSLQGTNVADVLAPYEVLADTGAFNLYTVAERREPVPMTGGLDLIPDLSFAHLAARLSGTPDAIVVPQLHDAGKPSARPIVEWLQRQDAEGDPLLVSVCVGARVLASAGLLDGRPATSHWLGLIGLRRSYPAVQWQEGVRYVEDGDVITAAGVLSGVDAALRVVERIVGRDAAEQAAEAVAWPDYSPVGAARIPQLRPALADTVGLLSAAYRWDRPKMGVLLTNGVGEIELAAAFRPYTELSYLARPVAVTVDGQPVRSRHGLTFAPRADLKAAAPQLDRLVIPGADAARLATAWEPPEGLAPVYLHTQSGFGFDGALRDIARTRDVATAQWVAKTLQYPSTNPQLTGAAWPWSLTLRPIVIAISAAVPVGLIIKILRGRGRGQGSGMTTSADKEA
jgi:transcriptional regulator GlxA family with amidase domain